VARRHELLWARGALQYRRIPTVGSDHRVHTRESHDKLYSAFVQMRIQIVERQVVADDRSKLVRTGFFRFGVEPSVRLCGLRLRTDWWVIRYPCATPHRPMLRKLFQALDWCQPVLNHHPARANGSWYPETLLGYEAGFRRLLGSKVYVDLAGFYNRLTTC